jgi:hypothetical protein
MEGGLERVLFGQALPGVGFDFYWIWEMLTMGVALIVEKVWDRTDRFIAYPRSSSRTFAMFRQAYVEAVYRPDEFEFERLLRRASGTAKFPTCRRQGACSQCWTSSP